MWETLSRNDIEAVRTQLQSRREEILRRHAEELGGIEREQAEIGLLDQMIDAFSNKFNSAAPEEKEETAKAIGQSVGVSLLITQAQRSQLRELGFHEEQIRSMKPIEAHQILGIAS
jgi:hypothetical protein